MTNNNHNPKLPDLPIIDKEDKTLEIPGSYKKFDDADAIDIPKAVEAPLTSEPARKVEQPKVSQPVHHASQPTHHSSRTAPRPEHVSHHAGSSRQANHADVRRAANQSAHQVKESLHHSSGGSNNSTPPKKHSSKKNSSQGLVHNMSWVHIAMTVVTALANIAFIYIMLTTTQFSGLSKTTFILVNIGVMLLLLVLDIIVMLAIRSKKKLLYQIGAVVLAIALFVGAYGAYALFSVNQSVNQITNTVVKESVSASLVVYSEDGDSPISNVSQLEGKVVGYVAGTNTGTLGQNRIKSENVNASYEEYIDYSSELIALFNGEIDCAVLPTNYMSMFKNETGINTFLDNTKSILDFEESVTVTNETGADKDITKEPFTVLLVGNADGLSDTMIVCSVNPISLKVTMSSIARDSYVPISCYGGGTTKLNASHGSGVNCTIDTIENLLGIEIDYYIDTNFQGVVDIVDALGGIVVNSPIEFVGQNSNEERGHYTVYIPAGDNVVLNGEQALAFARERHLFATGDFARQEHQQMVIKSIMTSILRTRDVNTFLKVLKAAGDNIQTNLTVNQMTSFMSYVLQKANRYYNANNIEDIFDIQNSRVTGYSSGIWDSRLEIAIYIYRLWNGSLADTRRAIERNIDLTSPKTATTDRIKWSVNWEYTADPISYDFYPEAMIPSEVPPEVEAQQNAACGVNEQYDLQSDSCTCAPGYTRDSNGVCVDATGGSATPEPEDDDDDNSNTPAPTTAPTAAPTATPVACGLYNTATDGSSCWCINGYGGDPYSVDGCTVEPATPTPDVPVDPTPDPTPDAPVDTPTPTPEEGGSDDGG